MNNIPYPVFPDSNINRNCNVTIGDLIDFKAAILAEMKLLLKECQGQPIKQWLKSNEVRKLLGLSPGTMQTLRNNGTLPFTRIGGVVYYNSEDIHKMMEEHRIK